jgi:hypothetical protein
MRPRLLLVVFLASLLELTGASSADAAFPGANGKIAFWGDGIHTINPDGTGNTIISPGVIARWRPDGNKISRLTTPPYNPSDAALMNPDGTGVEPLAPSNSRAWVNSWSPDGQKIAWWLCVDGSSCFLDFRTRLVIANADGTNETFVTDGSFQDRDAAWSPDAQKIAFLRAPILYDGECECEYVGPAELYVMNSDGTGQTSLGPAFTPPDWSPDGQKIAVSLPDPTTGRNLDIFAVNADGSGQTRLTTAGRSDIDPAWSPDGTKIAFNSARDITNGGELYVMNADGSGQTRLTNNSVAENDADWQPLQVPAYPHPQSASQLNVALVPAFKPCGTGGNPSNAKHAPPLAISSCNPPKPSMLAVVGTSSQGSAQMTVVPGDSDPTNGNQANVSLTAALSDIQATAGGDYNPNASGADLTAVTRLRFTDKANGYGGLPATATEYDFRVPIDCSSTPDPSVGSSCSATTTSNALIPGLIQEQRQTVVQAFRVRIDDSGANGIRGDADDRIFATQGLFLP